MDDLIKQDTVEEVASFDDVVIWGHEDLPEPGDMVMRGVSEWITFAETVSLQIFEENEAYLISGT